MKTLKKLLLFVVASALLAGCTSYKNVPYMQNPEVVNSYREDLPLYDDKDYAERFAEYNCEHEVILRLPLLLT